MTSIFLSASRAKGPVPASRDSRADRRSRISVRRFRWVFGAGSVSAASFVELIVGKDPLVATERGGHVSRCSRYASIGGRTYWRLRQTSSTRRSCRIYLASSLPDSTLRQGHRNPVASFAQLHLHMAECLLSEGSAQRRPPRYTPGILR